MKKTRDTLEAMISITRPLNCAMAAFATLLGFWLSIGRVLLPFELLLAGASTFFVCAGGQAINDYFDREVDRKSRRTRPIPSGKISAIDARNFAFALFILGCMLAAEVNESAFGMALAFSVMLYAYSSVASKHKYMGNALVALATAFTFILGASLSGLYLLVANVAAASFFATWAREIAKDFEDLKTDKGSKTTLPMAWGKGNARNAAVFATAMAVVFGILPILSGKIQSFPFLALLGVGIGVFLTAVYQLDNKKYSESQKSYKIGMLLVLAAFASTLI